MDLVTELYVVAARLAHGASASTDDGAKITGQSESISRTRN